MSEDNTADNRSDYHKRLGDAWSKYSDIKTEIKKALSEWAEHLGIDEISLTNEQQYDDNNYYNQYTIEKVMGVGCYLQYHHMDDEFAHSVEAFKEAVPPNSFKFITDKDWSLNYLLSPYCISELKEEHDETHIDILAELARRGIDIDEGVAFLSQLADVGEDTCPHEWEL
jgi:hypothetical protein